MKWRLGATTHLLHRPLEQHVFVWVSGDQEMTMVMGQPSADSRVEGRSCQQIASLRLVVVRVPPLALWVLVVSARHLSWRYGLATNPSPDRRSAWTMVVVV